MEIIVLDGHDGSGKSSLADRLSRVIDAPVLKPYVGSVSEACYRYVASGDHNALNTLLLGAVADLTEEYGSYAHVIFDRHWATAFSLVPEALYGAWRPLPRTVITWANPEVTLRRVTARGELVRNTLEYHREYCAVFREIAAAESVPLVDTSDSSKEGSVRVLLAMLGLS